MKTILFIAALLWTTSGLIRGHDNENWRSLFDGESLAGWQIVGGEGDVSIVDGSIQLRQVPNTLEHCFIRTEAAFSDFILEMEFRRAGGFCYGILFRAEHAPVDADVELFGYQVKVDHDPNRAWTGGVFDDFGSSWNWMYTLENDARARGALKPVGEWDRYRIEAIGDRIKIWLNDVPTAYIENRKYPSGSIALKIHFLKAASAREGDAAWVRDIRILTGRPERFSREIDIPMVSVPDL